jgi:hypothetical protein
VPVYVRATPAALSDRPKPSSSQPTGWRGRRLASTAPTVAVLSAPSTGGNALGVRTTSSGRAVWRSSWSSQTTTATPSMTRAHSAHASTAGHRRGRPSPAIEVTVMVFAVRSAPPALDLPTSRITCQCGRPASGQRYGRRTGRGPPRLLRLHSGNRCSPCHPIVCRMRSNHPFDHPDDPSGSVGSRLDRRGIQREQPRSVWSRPDRRRASVS